MKVSANELCWLRAIAEHAPVFRDRVNDMTRGASLVPGTLTPYLQAKAKLEGALNELRIAHLASTPQEPKP